MDEISINIFRKTGIWNKMIPEKTAFLVVKIFGKIEVISCYDKDSKRISRIAPKKLDTSDYRGYYRVDIKDIESWEGALNGCSNPTERWEKWRRLNGYD